MTSENLPKVPTDPAPLLVDAGLRYVSGGVSLIPCDGNKKPFGAVLPINPKTGKPGWGPYQEKAADADTVRRWCATPGVVGLALVGGKVSGGLCILDFDEPGFYEAWYAAVGDLADGLPVQQTGGGGYQVAFRCDNPGRNDGLAWVPDADPKNEVGRRIAIETRAEGGYAVLPPSLHPSGNYYKTISGDFANIPKIPQARADALLNAARKLDQCPFTKQQLERMKVAKVKSDPVRAGQPSVIDEWNRRIPIRQMLQRAGYVPFGDRFTRPGKDASLGGVVIIEDSRSFHWSTNDDLHDGHAHDSFSVFCELEHKGDSKAAVKAAAAELGLARPEPKPASPPANSPAPVDLSSIDGGAIANEMLSDIIAGRQAKAFPTGFAWIDDRLNAGGLELGYLVLVVARPNVGKSTFVRWLIEQILVANPGLRVLLFDAEARARVTIFQMAARRCQLPVKSFYRGLRDLEATAIVKAELVLQEVAEFLRNRLFISTKSDFTPMALDREIDAVQPEIIVLDDLQAINVVGADGNTRDMQRMAWISEHRRAGRIVFAVCHERKMPANADRLEVVMGHSVSAYRADMVLSMDLDGDPTPLGLIPLTITCDKSKDGPRGWSVKVMLDAATASIEVDA